jgi:transcriptional regulator with XRE-family HTH domain
VKVIIETIKIIPLDSLMKENNISDRKLGELSGIHYTQVSRIRNGHSRTSVKTAKRLLAALGVSDESIR